MDGSICASRIAASMVGLVLSFALVALLMDGALGSSIGGSWIAPSSGRDRELGGSIAASGAAHHYYGAD